MLISAISRMISLPVVHRRVRHPGERPPVEQRVIADSAEDADRPLECANEIRGYVGSQRHGISRHFAVIWMPMAVTTTLTTNSAMNA